MRHIQVPALSAPRGYSHAVESTAGRTIYVSGQIALDREGQIVGPGDVAVQTRQVFENLKTVLTAADASLGDLVKITVFMTDVSQIGAFRAVRDEYFTGDPPASSLVQVSALVLSELVIEVEAIAVVESTRTQ